MLTASGPAKMSCRIPKNPKTLLKSTEKPHKAWTSDVSRLIHLRWWGFRWLCAGRLGRGCGTRIRRWPGRRHGLRGLE